MPLKNIADRLGKALSTGMLAVGLLLLLGGCGSAPAGQPTPLPTSTLAPVVTPTVAATLPPTEGVPTVEVPSPTLPPAETATFPLASPTAPAEQTAVPTVGSKNTPVPLGDLQWKQVGLAGVNVTSLSFVAQGADVSVLAAGPKGVWTSTYDYTKWDKRKVAMAAEARGAGAVVASLDVMYVTSGTGCPSGLPTARSRSTDGGKTWQAMGGEANTITASNATTAYGAKCSGLNKTTDSGATWSDLPISTQSSDPISLASSPDGQIVYAAYVSEGGTGQIWVSKDGGATWSDVTPRNVPAEGFVGPADLTFVPAMEGRPGDGGLYLTNNEGVWFLPLDGGDWKLMKKPVLPTDTPGGYNRYSALFVDTAYSADYDKPGPIIYTARAKSGESSEIGQGIFRSSDMGATWESVGRGMDQHIVYSLALIPYDSGSGRVETLLAATENGVWATTMPPSR